MLLDQLLPTLAFDLFQRTHNLRPTAPSSQMPECRLLASITQRLLTQAPRQKVSPIAIQTAINCEERSKKQGKLDEVDSVCLF